MVATWMVRMDLFERVGLKVCFLTCVTYFFYFSGTPMNIMEWTKLERAFAVEALFFKRSLNRRNATCIS